MVSIQIEDKDKASEDIEMDTTNENKAKQIKITIKDENDNIIFEKLMVINEADIKIRPFLLLIEEFCQKDKSLRKYKKFFKSALYQKFKIPELKKIEEDDF